MKNYKHFIWHNPNCPAWNRNPATNKPFPHLVKKFGDKYKCMCGYDEDFKFMESTRVKFAQILKSQTKKVEVIEMASSLLRVLISDEELWSDLEDLDVLDFWINTDVAKYKLETLEKVLEILK